MRLAKQLGAGFVVLLILVLAIQNHEAVELRFLKWSLSISRLILLPALFLLGVGTGAVLLTAAGHRKASKDH